jgi:hypothetical protein
VPKFTSGTAIGDSLIYDNGTNVGIGTASPSYTLDVAGSTNVSVNNFHRYNGDTGIIGSATAISGGSNTQLGIRASSDILFATNGASERMRISSGGNVGIGTTAPSVKLTVSNASNGNIALFTNASDADLNINLTSGVTLLTPSTGILALGTSSTERMRITSTGNVGIGTSSPTTVTNYIVQTINGTSGSFTEYQQGGSYAFRIGSDSSLGGFLNQTDANPIRFFINNGERMRITSGGNVGIGTTAPDDKLHVVTNGTTAYGSMHLTNSNSEASLYLGVGGSSVANTALRNRAYVMNSTASDLVLGTSDAARVIIRDDGYIRFPDTYSGFTSGAAANMYMFTDGGIYRSTSSIKYKKNVQDYTKGLAEVMQLRPVSYEGKGDIDIDKHFAGLIAEEVHDLGLTEFVQYAEDGTPDALAYSNMVSLLVKAIQEQQKQIDELKAKIK